MTAPPDLHAQLAGVPPCEIVVGMPTYNNGPTAKLVAEAARAGLDRYFAGTRAVLINADAGSSDDTVEQLAAAGLPMVRLRDDAPLTERMAVPFHGVPGRGAALHLTFTAAQRLGARVLLLLEADVTSTTDAWIGRLAGPVLNDKADLVTPAYARHRYEGTITNLLVAPLLRALYGRRLQQPLAGAQALSARLLAHLLSRPRWNRNGRDVTDPWAVGTAIADGFAVCEARLGPRRVASGPARQGLPEMMAQTMGAVFSVMHLHQDLWLETRGSEPVTASGEAISPTNEPMLVDVERMVLALRQGLRDLGPIWEHILTPETFGDVLALERSDTAGFCFPDDVWARVVYDFALGHHYDVVYRDHLVRSLVPLYLGRTAAFVLATRGRDAVASEAHLEALALAFERRKPYLTERWR